MNTNIIKQLLIIIFFAHALGFMSSCTNPTSADKNNEGTSVENVNDSIAQDSTLVESNGDARLVISCNIQDALVEYNGNVFPIKDFESKGKEMQPGNYNIKISKDGFETKDITVNIEIGQVNAISVNLLKAQEKLQEKLDTDTPQQSETKQPSPAPSSDQQKGTHAGHEWVDLGLPSSIKWATCNVGANSPTQYGNYYAWGEIKTKSEYTEENNTTIDLDIEDISGNPKYDVARSKWGGKWRMPTYDEFIELFQNCDCEWSEYNGENGLMITSKKNGKFIFLPSCGFMFTNASYFPGGRGYYWCSDAYIGETPGAYRIIFSEKGGTPNVFNRHIGQAVRPVVND